MNQFYALAGDMSYAGGNGPACRIEFTAHKIPESQLNDIRPRSWIVAPIPIGLQITAIPFLQLAGHGACVAGAIVHVDNILGS